MLEGMNLAILIGAGLVTVSIFTSLVSFRVGAPLLLVFLGLGLLAGENGLGLEFDDAPVAYFVGSLALAVILFDSGFGTRLRSFRLAAAPALVLATLGVALTSALTAVAARHLFGFGWLEAALMAAVVGSTDAAAVFFLLRVGGITIRERVRATLEIESGSNDPMAIFLTLTVVELLAGQAGDGGLGWAFAQSFGLQFGLGAALGLAGGWLIVQAVNRIDLERALFPLVVMSMALLLFAVTNMLDGSGFLAVYLAGLVAGNARLRAANPLRRFQEGMTWLSQIVMFLTLGLFATPSEFLGILGPALALGLVLTFVARPAAVWLCLWPFRFSRQETGFVAWVGLRGAVSILLAILPFLHGLPDAQTIFNASFLVVLVSLLLQGWTIAPAARWLGVMAPIRHGPLKRVELELPGAVHHELVAYRILAKSPVTQGERLPRWARPALVVRDGRRLDVHSAGLLRPGDYVYIFTTPRQVGLLDRLFASQIDVSRDDPELFGEFFFPATAPLAELGRTYGFAVSAKDQDLAAGELLAREFGDTISIGDRLAYGPVELIACALRDDGRVETVGVALEPIRPVRPWLRWPWRLSWRPRGGRARQAAMRWAALPKEAAGAEDGTAGVTSAIPAPTAAGAEARD